ncbi:MAG: MerR family transcriptional regulator [Fulvivirga sp.]
MGKYSIKELEKLSGIKAHTLRIWEKRYAIIKPDRTDTNIRKYSDEELKKLLNISILNHHGVKISKISKMKEEEIKLRVTELSAENHDDDLSLYIDQLSIAMVELDELKFEKLLSNYILRFGFEKTILDILYPFLEKIGVLWLSGNITPVQEHFMSNLIRQKIIVAIDGLSATSDKQAESVVLFLPEGELHEIGLLFYCYIVKKLQYNTFYLGQSVPLNDLKKITDQIKPNYLLTSVTHIPTDTTVEELITQLSSKFPSTKILISGYPIQQYDKELPKNVSHVTSALELKANLK